MLTKTNDRLKYWALDIARLEEQRAELSDEIRQCYGMAKDEGFTPKALKQAIKIHSMDSDKRAKHDAEQLDMETYLANLEGRTLA